MVFPLIRNVSATLCLVGIAAATAAESPSAEGSFFTIGKMPEAPKVDGLLADGDWPSHEWAMSTHLSGFTRLDELVAPSVEPSVRVGYDSENLYVGFSVRGLDQTDILTLASKPDSWEIVRDQGFEAIVGIGDEPGELHQFIVNASGVHAELRHAGGEADWDWSGTWQRAVSRTPHGWEAEFAIPWKTLGVSTAPEGQTLRMNFMHNNPVSGKEHSTWGSLEDSSGKWQRFGSLETMPEAVLGGDGAVAGSTFDGSNLENPQVVVRTANPSDGELILQAQVGSSGPRPLTVLPGEQGRWRVGVKVDEEGAGQIPLMVKREDGEIVLRHLMRYRSLLGQNLRLTRHFPENFINVEVRTEHDTESQLIMVAKGADGTELGRVEETIPAEKITSVRMDISDWPIDAPIALECRQIDPDGKPIGGREFSITRPAKPDWAETKVGLTDEPIPPFTAIEVEGDTLSALIKDYQFEGRTLPSQVLSDGIPVLAGPIELQLQVGDETIDLASAPIEVTSRAANRIEWKSGPLTAGGVQVSTTGWMEEDGFMWFTVTLDASAPVTVDSLDLRVPVIKEFANLFTASDPSEQTRITEGETVDSTSGKLPSDGVRLSRFFHNISLHNYERGMSLIMDAPREWHVKDFRRSQSIEVGEASTTIQAEIINQPLTLSGQRTFQFGLMSMPAKPIDRKVRLTRVGYAHPYAAVNSIGVGGVSRVEFPMEGNLDPRQGTLELYVHNTFDPSFEYPDPTVANYLMQQLLRFLGPDGELGRLQWNYNSKALEFSQGNSVHQLPVRLAADTPWKGKGWHHVALSWSDDEVRLFVDGKLAGEAQAPGGLFGTSAPDLKDLRVTLGKRTLRDRADFRVAGVRVSSSPLPLEDMAQDGKFAERPDTLFLQTFGADAVADPDALPPRRDSPSLLEFSEDFRLPAPAKGVRGEVIDLVQIVDTDGIPSLAFGTVPDLNSLEYAATLDFEYIGYHQDWPELYGAASPTDKASALTLKSLRDSVAENGMKLLVYVGFGLNREIPESQLYMDHWRKEPPHTGGPSRGPMSYAVTCKSVSSYTDYMIDGLSKTMDKYKIDGLFYDNTTTPYACKNPLHDCGWVDEQGELQSASDILATRAYLKRLYAMVHERGETGFIESHSSGFISPVRAAWVDRFYVGEQFAASRHPFNFENFAATSIGEPFGMPSQFLFFHRLRDTWTPDQVLAFTLLFDIEMDGGNFTGSGTAQRRALIPLWQVRKEFDTTSAEWHPFWKNESLVTVEGGDSYASLFLHPGKRALLMVSNVGEQAADVDVSVNLEELGLPQGRARDAYTKEPIEMQDGEINLSLNALGDMRMIWIDQGAE